MAAGLFVAGLTGATVLLLRLLTDRLSGPASGVRQTT